MLGLRVRYRGAVYSVLEVIEDGPAIVIEPEIAVSSIQTDAYGNARRHTRSLLTIPVLSADRREIHPEFLAIDLL
jgi:hypothetical protein